MKPLFRSFRIFISQIIKDSMLVVVCIAPILTALFFRYGIPFIEELLCDYFQKAIILAGYYLLFDLFLSLITPYMFCFASSMVMLTEFDENIASYMAVTPVRKSGYVLSRLLFPAIISFVASVILMNWFTLTKWAIGMILIICFLTCILSIIISLMIFTVSNNRVEGMALAKMAGLLMFGLLIPFFILSDVQYAFSPLPSFWIAKLRIEQNIVYIFPAILTSMIWIWLLYIKFRKKIQ